MNQIENLEEWLVPRLQRGGDEEVVYHFLLPLLQQPWREVEVKLEAAVQAGRVSKVNLISTLELLKYGLSASRGWATIAVSWLEDGFPINDELVEAIDKMCASKGMPQRARHTAFALARRYQRAQRSG